MDDLFFGSQMVPQKVETIFARSNELIVKVKALPQVGRPADFGEAVGEYKMDVGVEPTTVRAFDPITVRMRIDGAGDVQAVKSPRVGDTTGFKSYAGDVKTALARADGKLGGSKTFTMILEPQSAEVKEVPQVTFSFFDTKAGRYATLRQGPFPIKVLPAEREQLLVLGQPPGSGAKKDYAVELAKDIMPIATDLGGLSRNKGPLYLSLFVWAVLPVPWVVGGVAYLVRRRRDRLRSDPGYARVSRAMREARRKLREVRAVVAGAAAKEIYGALGRIVSEFIADKLNLPPASVAAESARHLLAERGVSSEIADPTIGFFTECDQARFSAEGAVSANVEEIFRKAEMLLKRLNRVL
jgi:hypothetical protein